MGCRRVSFFFFFTLVQTLIYSIVDGYCVCYFQFPSNKCPFLWATKRIFHATRDRPTKSRPDILRGSSWSCGSENVPKTTQKTRTTIRCRRPIPANRFTRECFFFFFHLTRRSYQRTINRPPFWRYAFFQNFKSRSDDVEFKRFFVSPLRQGIEGDVVSQRIHFL